LLEYIPGLAGIPAARSSICFIDGSVGKLQYRGFPIEVLAERCSYEEVAYLLVFKRLPTTPQLDEFRNELIAERGLKFRIIDLLKTLPESGQPMTRSRRRWPRWGCSTRETTFQTPSSFG